jgi:hypothetical protein
MKILSKVHDYYDSAAAYGVSDQYWKRQNDTFHEKDVELEDIMHYTQCWGGRPMIIMFCGKAYPVIFMRGRGGYDSRNFLIAKEDDFPVYRELYEAGLNPPYPGAWEDIDEGRRRFSSPESYARRGFQGFLDDVAKIDCEKYHRQYNAPIIRVGYTYIDKHGNYQDNRGRWRHKVTIETNPSLKALGFQKVKDAFTAYQELDSYIFGVLGVDVNPTVEISDVHRLEGHGFDKRTSFRNMKR